MQTIKNVAITLHITQVQNLVQAPMSIVCKMAPILGEDILFDIMPIAWELLLSSDQELAASAGKIDVFTKY